MRNAAIAGAIVLGLAAGSTAVPSHAAPCGVFTDVDSNDPFCQNVQWLRNRGVTLGCTATTYCPNDFVPRSQMAAFMNRLATALTPVQLYRHLEIPEGTDFTSVKPLCATTAFDIQSFPRSMTFRATITGSLSADASLQFIPVYSTNNGTTWSPITGYPTYVSAGVAQASKYYSAATMTAPVTLLTGASYRFAVNAVRIDGASPVSAGPNSWCQVAVDLRSIDGAQPPFDDTL